MKLTSVGPETYEAIHEAGKALPANKAPRPEGPFTVGHGDWFVTPNVREEFGDELLDAINKPGGTPIIPKGYATGGYVVQKPSVGRIVLYRWAEPYIGLHPAIITNVSDDPEDARVSLCVFGENGVEHVSNVSYSVSTGGCWSWPPRA